MGPLPADYVRAVIDHAWKPLARLCERHHDLDTLLDDVETSEMHAERRHRKGGHSKEYRLSIQHAARMFVMQHVYKTPVAPVAPSVFTSRPEILRCYALGHLMHTYTHDVGSVFATWEDAINQPHLSTSTPPQWIAGELSKAPGVLAEKLRAYAARYGETYCIPIIMALDYARDIAGMDL
jgi:hypothetical protein